MVLKLELLDDRCALGEGAALSACTLQSCYFQLVSEKCP